MLSVVKILLKRVVGGCALNSHGITSMMIGKSWKNHGIVFLNFCGNPVSWYFEFRGFGIAKMPNFSKPQ